MLLHRFKFNVQNIDRLYYINHNRNKILKNSTPDDILKQKIVLLYNLLANIITEMPVPINLTGNK